MKKTIIMLTVLSCVIHGCDIDEFPQQKESRLRAETFMTQRLNSPVDDLCRLTINSKDSNNRNNLVFSLAHGFSYPHIEMLIMRGESIDDADIFQDTALHYAINFGRKDVVQLLLQHKADVTIKNGSGLNAYDLAVRERNQGIIKLVAQYTQSDTAQVVQSTNT